MKRTKPVARILALCLCFTLLLSSCGNWQRFFTGTFPFGAGGDDDGGRRTVPFSEMTYERPDVAAISASLAAIAEKMRGAKSYEEMAQYDEEAGTLLEQFSTASTIAYLYNAMDSTDAYYEEERRFCSDSAVTLSNLQNQLLEIILESPYAGQYRSDLGDYYFEDMRNTTRLNSPEVEAQKQRRNQLEVDYSTLSNSFTIDYNGEAYDMNRITALDDYYLYIDLLTRYCREGADQFTAIFAEMVELDREIAATLGFDSAADMYYLSYSRDYTPADALGFAALSRQYFAPLVSGVYAANVRGIQTNQREVFRLLPKALGNLDERFADVWNNMIDYELCNYDPMPGKQSGSAFTTYINGYDAPFCLGYFEDDWRSATTVVHEFGHFYDDWIRYDESVVFNLDIAEVYSQGMEVLLQQQYDLFTDNVENAERLGLRDFTNSLTYQIALEEFTQRAYQLEEINSQTMAALYTEVMAGFGLDDYYGLPDEDGLDYTWFLISHVFEAPFYTVSYWTSAVVALQIWAIQQDDPEAAVNTYVELIHSDQNRPFTEIVEGAGLRAPGDEAALADVAENFAAAFGVNVPLPAAA